jgi:hypothetical protein
LWRPRDGNLVAQEFTFARLVGLPEFKGSAGPKRLLQNGGCWLGTKKNSAAATGLTETLFGSLKVERLHGMHFGTRRQAIRTR